MQAATVLYGDALWVHGVLDQLGFAVVAVIWFGAFLPIAIKTATGTRGVPRVR